MKERIQEFTEFIDHNLLIIRNISTLLVTTGVSLIIYDLFKRQSFKTALDIPLEWYSSRKFIIGEVKKVSDTKVFLKHYPWSNLLLCRLIVKYKKLFRKEEESFQG
jgi:hypothetical protein